MKKTVYMPEIIEEINKAKKKEDKIVVLHKYADVKGFKHLLYICYDPLVEWMVTRAEVENIKYPSMDIRDYDLAPQTLFLLAKRRLFAFTNCREGGVISKEKVIRNLGMIFSSLHHEEVELLKQVINRKIKANGLTANLVREAFPGLLHDIVVKEKEKDGVI